MYMNCVNAEFTGGDSSEMQNFPAMFVANLASVDKCPTTESINVLFPQPGKYVTTKTENDPYPLATPSGDGCSGGAAPHYVSAQPSPLPPTSAAAPRPAPTPVASYTPVQTPAATSPALPIPSGVCTDGTISCPKPGQIICVDSAHFGICDLDFCAVPVAVAPGTVCKNGAIGRKKRSVHDHSHGYFHQHAN